MPKPVYLLTVQEAHEYSSLTDQIRAKYEQLDSGEFGSPDTPSFVEDYFLVIFIFKVTKISIWQNW